MCRRGIVPTGNSRSEGPNGQPKPASPRDRFHIEIDDDGLSRVEFSESNSG